MKRILAHTYSALIAASTLALACSSSNDTPAAGSGTGGSSTDGSGGASGSGTTNGGASGVGGAGVGGAGVGGGTGTGGATITECGDKSACTGKKALGLTLDACCIDATTCGIKAPAQYAQAFPGCNPVSALANVPANAPDGGFTLPEGGIPGFTPETVVLDPSCPDTTGPTGVSKGCCDKTGICGGAVTQINQCFTAADLVKLGGGAFSFDAGPQKTCTYTGK